MADEGERGSLAIAIAIAKTNLITTEEKKKKKLKGKKMTIPTFLNAILVKQISQSRQADCIRYELT